MSAARCIAAACFVVGVGGTSSALAEDYRFPILLSSASPPYVTAYFDLAGGGGQKDWNCGGNTYNGHRGTDIGIGGFAAMDAGSRWVVAASAGTVTAVVDGCFDRCTTANCSCGGGFGNYVKVTHADGKSTYYGHLKNGSVQVGNGAQVSCGQKLGKVGSSGNSTGPHLHFEVRYSSNTSDDPFSGPCGGPLSYWRNQGDYNALPSDACEAPVADPPPEEPPPEEPPPEEPPPEEPPPEEPPPEEPEPPPEEPPAPSQEPEVAQVADVSLGDTAPRAQPAAAKELPASVVSSCACVAGGPQPHPLLALLLGPLLALLLRRR